MSCDPACGSYCQAGGGGEDPGEGGPAEPQCVQNGTGVLLHDNIADFELTNCLGETLHLHSMCGEAKAVWMVLIAGWCSACAGYIPQVESALTDAQSIGAKLQVIYILGEDASGNAPDQGFCQRYAQGHGIEPSRVYMDTEWDTVFHHIFPYLPGGNNLLLPWEALLDGDNMEYVWHSPDDGSPLPMNLLGQVLND